MKKFIFACTVFWAQSALAVFHIPLKSVRQVAIVIADPGQATESSHGHAAMRISWSDSLTEKDLVVNFGANVPRDAQGKEVPQNGFINALRGIGLSKKYPSQVTASNYSQFKGNYKKESRGVSTYIVDLTKLNVPALVSFVNAQLSAAKGRRDFQILKYNCAVMTLEALNAGLLEPISRVRGANMPDELPRILKARGIILKEVYDAVI